MGHGTRRLGMVRLAAGQLSHHVVVHAIDPKTGKLNQLKRYEVAEGSQAPV